MEWLINRPSQTLEKLDELDNYLEENSWIIDDLVCPLVLARIEVERGRYDNAESVISRSLEQESPDDTALKHSLLGQIISAPIRRAFNDDPPLPWNLPNDLEAQLARAESHLTKAIELLQGRQDQGRLHDALVNRSGVRGMLHKYSQGLEDCNRVLADNPQDIVAIRNKGILLLHLEQTADAITCLEQLKTVDDWPSVALIVASGYDELGEPNKAVDTIRPYWTPGEGGHHQLFIAHFLLRAYHKLNDREQVEEITEHVKTNCPSDPEALLILAQQRHRDGEVDESIELMQESLKYSKRNQRDRVALQLAEILYSERRYTWAVETYKLIVNTSHDNSVFRAYLTSLFNAGLYSEALKLAREMRGDGEQIPVITEIEASVLEYIGDLKAAEALWWGLAINQPDNAMYIVNTALTQFRQGKREPAKETISSLRYEIIKDDPNALLSVARVKSILLDDDVLPLVYRARQIDYGNPETHLAYFQFFLDSEKRGSLDLSPTSVGVDCTVHLVRQDEKRIFTILDDDSLDPARGELSPKDPLALQMTGLKQGDTLIIRQPYENLEYEVSAIQSKYVYAFQQTLADFPTIFPNHLGIQRMPIRNDDFSSLFRSVDERHEFVSQIIAEYKKQRLTLAACLGNGYLGSGTEKVEID